MGHERIASLDLLRGMAAFSVAVPHYLAMASVAPATAEAVSVLGVEVFFVLSGFVLAPQIIFCATSKRWSFLKVFLVRRWMRTVPPYLFALTVASYLAQPVALGDLARYALYLQNLFYQANTLDYYAVAWSLSVEEWFYVVFPATAMLVLLRAGRPSLASFAAVAIGFIAVVTLARLTLGSEAEWGERVRRVVVFRIDSIAYGFLLYVWVTAIPVKHGAGRVAAWGLAAAVMAAIAFLNVSALADNDGLRPLHQLLFPFLATAAGAALILLCLAVAPYVERWGMASLATYLGAISYSVYLFHIFVAAALAPQLTSLSVVLQVAIYCAVVAMMCTVFYRYFEAPILAMRPRYRSVVELESEERPRVTAVQL